MWALTAVAASSLDFKLHSVGGVCVLGVSKKMLWPRHIVILLWSSCPLRVFFASRWKHVHSTRPTPHFRGVALLLTFPCSCRYHMYNVQQPPTSETHRIFGETLGFTHWYSTSDGWRYIGALRHHASHRLGHMLAPARKARWHVRWFSFRCSEPAGRHQVLDQMFNVSWRSKRFCSKCSLKSNDINIM